MNLVFHQLSNHPCVKGGCKNPPSVFVACPETSARMNVTEPGWGHCYYHRDWGNGFYCCNDHVMWLAGIMEGR